MKANDKFAFVLGQAWSGAVPDYASGLYGYLETYYDAESRKPVP